MAWQIVFTDSGFWKYSLAHLRARRPRASNKGLRPCPLRTEISPVSVDDDICIAFAIWGWGTLVLKYSTIFLRTLSQIGAPLPIFTSERLCLSKALNTLHDCRLSQKKDWHRETIVANQKSPRLFHNACLSSGTAENRAVCLGLKTSLFIANHVTDLMSINLISC